MWRARRSCRGELVQWDTSEHDWLEGRGEKLYLISMIDDATSELMARSWRSDSTEENMRLLWKYLEQERQTSGVLYRQGQHVSDGAENASRAQAAVDGEREPLPPTQIGRALQELEIVWIAAHTSAGERQGGAPVSARPRTVWSRACGWQASAHWRQANQYLEQEFLPWWNAHSRSCRPTPPMPIGRSVQSTVWPQR